MRQAGEVGTSGCPDGLVRESSPVQKLHMGFISSSLGDFGGDVCPEDGAVHHVAQNDQAHLLNTLDRIMDVDLRRIVIWNATDETNGPETLQERQAQIRAQVRAVGELGCGVEMGMEAWYRFLADPIPPEGIVHSDAEDELSPIVRTGLDSDILSQRESFLRDDSLLVVLMLSNENDASMNDQYGMGWLAARAYVGARRFLMRSGSSVCAENPDDPCCYSCWTEPPAGCEADPVCAEETRGELPEEYDPVQLRFFDQKRRFGMDTLAPVSRYVNALTLPELCPYQTYGNLDCDCREAQARGVACDPNPQGLPENEYRFANPLAARSAASRVILGGIVGTPWQDVASEDSLDNPDALRIQTGAELDWSLLVPGEWGDPMDPLMVESIEAREGTHPRTGEALMPPRSAYGANSINGHERETGGMDLQYACVFPLQQTWDCGEINCYIDPECTGDLCATDPLCVKVSNGCACDEYEHATSPVCQDPETDEFDLVERGDFAFPSTRQLQVLKGFAEATGADQSVVGSACPKTLDPTRTEESVYGYNATVDALVATIKPRLAAQ